MTRGKGALRGDIDDGAAPAAEMRQRSLGEEHRRGQVDAERHRPAGEVDIADRAARFGHGVVDQAVDGAEALQGEADEGARGRRVGEVAGLRFRRALAGDLIEAGRVVGRRSDHQPGAFARQAASDGPADAARGAGDNDHPPLQPSRVRHAGHLVPTERNMRRRRT